MQKEYCSARRKVNYDIISNQPYSNVLINFIGDLQSPEQSMLQQKLGIADHVGEAEVSN